MSRAGAARRLQSTDPSPYLTQATIYKSALKTCAEVTQVPVKIKPLKKYYKEASTGWAYSVVTEELHWWHGDGEGKTMGLAPYGDWTKCAGVLDRYFPVFDGSQLISESKLGDTSYWAENGSVQFHFEEAYEVEKLIETYGKEHIAAEA